jgi:hypothetical protein
MLSAISIGCNGGHAWARQLGAGRKRITPFGIDGSAQPDQLREYLIPKGKHIQVQPGDHVRAGDPLQDGPANPHDILRAKGEKELTAWLVNEIQRVYRLQGVGINNKNIEVIVRQMLRRVRIEEVGDTNVLVDEQVEKYVFERDNGKAMERGGHPAVAEPMLLGITKASLSTESFISASSFQRRPRCSPKQPSAARPTICAASRRTRHHLDAAMQGVPSSVGLGQDQIFQLA